MRLPDHIGSIVIWAASATIDRNILVEAGRVGVGVGYYAVIGAGLVAIHAIPKNVIATGSIGSTTDAVEVGAAC